MRNFNFLTILLLTISFVKLHGQKPLKTTNPNDEFVLMEDMSDEFNNGTINWSSKWEETNNLPNIAAWNLTNSNNVAEGNYFNRGAAKITARYNGKNGNGTSIAVNGKFYNAGCLQSQKSLPANFEGYIEAVIRGADIDNDDPHPFNEGIDRARGLCPAFWLYSKFFDANPGPGDVIYTEIDIQELQQHDFHDNIQDGVEDTESNLHIAFKDGNRRRWVRPKRNPEEQLNKYELGFDPRKDWHTYGCEITKEEISFFVDGKKVGKTLKNKHWSKLPLRVILSLGMRVPFVDFGGNAFTSFDPQGTYPNNDRLKNLAERARKQLGELPESMYVDYVRVWNKKAQVITPPPTPTTKTPLKTTNPNDEFVLIENMSDEFNNGTVNWSKKWEETNNLPNIAAWNLTNSNNVAEGNYFNRGAAKITARYNGKNRNGTSIAVNGKFYNAGCLQSQKSLPANFEGYVEAVIRGADIDNDNPHPFNGGIDRARGLCPAFWLYSKFFDANPGPGDVIYTEIDIQELQQHDFHDNKQDLIEDTESNLHIAFKDGNRRRWVRPKRNPEEQLNKYELGFDPRKDWHTYGCEITKEEISFFVDGKKVGKTLKNKHWSKLPLRVILSLGMRVPFVDFGGNAFTSFDPQGTYPNNDRLKNLAERARRQLGELPESMYVDYVRVWNKKTDGGDGSDTPLCNADSVITGLTATTSTKTSITVAFNEVKGVDSYELRVWEKGKFTGSINTPKAFAFKGGDSSPLTISDLNPGQEYTLVLRGLCSAGESTEISQIDVTTVPDTPICDTSISVTGLNISAKTKTSLTLTFDEIAGVDTYELRAWEKGNFTGSINTPKAFAFKGGDSSPLTISGLTPGQEYTLVLRGLCSIGGSTEISQIDATTIPDAPQCDIDTTITGLNILTKTKNSLTLAFDEITGVSNYELRAWEKGIFTGSINSPKAFSFKGGDSSPLTISGLNPGEEYTLVLRAVCSAGKSTKISQVNAITIADPKCAIDTVITGIQTTSSTKTSITLSFDEISGVSKYELRAWKKGKFSGSLNSPKAFAFKGGNSSPLTISGLDENEDYTLVLRAVCSAGKSTKISQINASTKSLVSKVITDNNESTNGKVVIFPNPIKDDYFSIILTDKITSEISVFDIQGKKVFQKQFNEKVITLKKDGLGKTGIYFIQINQGGTTITKKVVFQ